MREHKVYRCCSRHWQWVGCIMTDGHDCMNDSYLDRDVYRIRWVCMDILLGLVSMALGWMARLISFAYM